jgi:hypothetical protein
MTKQLYTQVHEIEVNKSPQQHFKGSKTKF